MTANVTQTDERDKNDCESFISDQSKAPDIETKIITKKKKKKKQKEK